MSPTLRAARSGVERPLTNRQARAPRPWWTWLPGRGVGVASDVDPESMPGAENVKTNEPAEVLRVARKLPTAGNTTVSPAATAGAYV